jgi:hypothetical protein
MVAFDCPRQSAPLVKPKTFILTRKWVTAPATQTTALSTSPGALSPHT